MPPESGPSLETTQPTLLLAEDDPNDVLLFRRAFERCGASCLLRVVHDGDQAIRYLEGVGPYADRLENPLPVVALLDLKMPRRTGLEVLEWLAAHPDLCRLPAVVLTSSRERADIERAYALGARSYLVKPGKFSDLLRLVEVINSYWVVFNERPCIERQRV